MLLRWICHSEGLNRNETTVYSVIKSSYFLLFVAPGGQRSTGGGAGRDGAGSGAEED